MRKTLANSNSANSEEKLICYDMFSELSQLMSNIEDKHAELFEELHACDLIGAEAFRIPRVMKDEESEPVEKIVVTPVKGHTAYHEAIRAYKNLYAEEGYSSKAAFRLPGYIQVSPRSSCRITKIVDQINSLAEAFKSKVTTISGASERHAIIHQLFPGLITKQLYRRLHTVEDVSSMGFFWAKKFVTNKTSKNAVLELLRSQRTKPPQGVLSSVWSSFVQDEMKLISELPSDCELRFKRPARVSPAVNIDAGEKKQISAHLPVIVLQKKPIIVRPLMNYDATTRRCARSDKQISGAPLIERLHLYMKRT